MIFEFQVSKVGKTIRTGFTSSAAVAIELVPWTGEDRGVFQPTSFAILVSKAAYIRQSTSSPSDATLEEEIPAGTYYRVDVEVPADRYIYVRAVSAAYGICKATEITRVDGTTAADTTDYGVVATGAMAAGKAYGNQSSVGTNVSGTSALSTIERYVFSSDTVIAATDLATARTEAVALGSPTYALIGGGQDTVVLTLKTDTVRYVYGTDSRVVSTAFGAGRAWACGAGNSTVGIINGGREANTTDAGTDDNLVSSEKFTYATEAVTAGTDIFNGSSNHDAATRPAAGSPTIGYWRGGCFWSLNYSGIAYYTFKTSFKYTYATDVVASSTAELSDYRLAGGAAASPTEGIWAGGATSPNTSGSSLRTIDVLTFATEAAVATTNALATGRRMVASLSDSASAIFSGGYGNAVFTALDSSEKFAFGSTTVAAAATLTQAIGSAVGASNCHGGIS